MAVWQRWVDSSCYVNNTRGTCRWVSMVYYLFIFNDTTLTTLFRTTPSSRQTETAGKAEGVGWKIVNNPLASDLLHRPFQWFGKLPFSFIYSRVSSKISHMFLLLSAAATSPLQDDKDSGGSSNVTGEERGIIYSSFLHKIIPCSPFSHLQLFPFSVQFILARLWSI